MYTLYFDWHSKGHISDSQNNRYTNRYITGIKQVQMFRIGFHLKLGTCYKLNKCLESGQRLPHFLRYVLLHRYRCVKMFAN